MTVLQKLAHRKRVTVDITTSEALVSHVEKRVKAFLLKRKESNTRLFWTLLSNGRFLKPKVHTTKGSTTIMEACKLRRHHGPKEAPIEQVKKLTSQEKPLSNKETVSLPSPIERVLPIVAAEDPHRLDYARKRAAKWSNLPEFSKNGMEIYTLYPTVPKWYPNLQKHLPINRSYPNRTSSCRNNDIVSFPCQHGYKKKSSHAMSYVQRLAYRTGHCMWDYE